MHLNLLVSFCLIVAKILWCSQNAIDLAEKEKKEKEMRNQIINEAEEYKASFYEKRRINCETNKAHNREREKVKPLKEFFIYSFFFLPCILSR